MMGIAKPVRAAKSSRIWDMFGLRSRRGVAAYFDCAPLEHNCSQLAAEFFWVL